MLETETRHAEGYFLSAFTERPDGERGNETALSAIGTRLSHPQLPEPHPGESANAAGAQ